MHHLYNNKSRHFWHQNSGKRIILHNSRGRSFWRVDLKTSKIVSFYTTAIAEGKSMCHCIQQQKQSFLTSKLWHTHYFTQQQGQKFLTFWLKNFNKCVIFHNSRGRMFRCADFKHEYIILYNSKSIHLWYQNSGKHVILHNSRSRSFWCVDLKTLINVSFYTTIWAECLDVLSLDFNVPF